AKTITFFLDQHELITALTTASAVAVLLIVLAFWTTHRIVPPFAGFPAAGLEPRPKPVSLLFVSLYL
ncbi:MAG: hypothetical protein RKO66_06665, partial [Candidatus Contendobacter sp.]|nr:hypothetical protein [Candidatus Contendobacter sp.]